MNTYTLAGNPKSAKRAVLIHSLAMDRHFWRPLALLDRAGWESALVAGASMGGCVALAFAARYSKRITALGLVDTTAWYGPRKSLPGIRVPATSVVDEEDYATPIGMAEALHKGIRGSTLTVLKRARHLTPLEKPEEIASELRKLL